MAAGLRAPAPGLWFHGRLSEFPLWMAGGQGRVSSLHPSLPPRLHILGSLAESSVQTKALFYLCPPISVVLRTSAVPSRHSAFSNTDSAQGMNHSAMWLWGSCLGCWLEHLPAGGRMLSPPREPQVSEHQDWKEGTGPTHSLHPPLLGYCLPPGPSEGEPWERASAVLEGAVPRSTLVLSAASAFGRSWDHPTPDTNCSIWGSPLPLLGSVIC